jgi:predicted ATPase/DNA-binding CsgD family transcriptional regulator/class 3 adenylate cyclase
VGALADIVSTGGSAATRAVTLVFADFEDAPRLWGACPDSMEEASALAREIVWVAAARHGGDYPVSREDDAVVAAFARPADALAAALDVQRAAAAREWPQNLGARLRLALHTSTPTTPMDRGGIAFGALERCARLCAVARGGQTVLSRATHDLVADRLPVDAELIDAGVHRLPDLGPPEHVYELAHPDAPNDRRPLRSLDTLASNLPVDLTTFVGRERELRDVAGLLDGTRLLTLTGAGGCGKTRLGLQTAAGAFTRFPDGLWLVELGPISDRHQVGQALAAAVGVRPLPGRRPLDAAITHLRERQALVLLDNCEHLLDAAAELVDDLLKACPEVTVLATSREPLGLPAETTWRVPSLSLPQAGSGEAAEALARSDAAQLFFARAAKVRPDLTLTERGARALATVCSELDGIPLAIELAAARVRMLSVEQIAEGLSDRFRLLSGGTPSGLSRHSTLRASVDWSHDLLSDDERALFRRLGIFAGGFTLDAVEQVAAVDGGERLAALDVLAALVDKSLVVAEERGSAVRYHLLETVREYALDHVRDAGELEVLRDRHRDFFLGLAETAAPKLVTTSCGQWLETLDADAANLGATLDWAVATDGERALRLCAALTMWWKLRAMLAQADAGYVRALDASDRAPSALRARVLWGRAYLLTFEARYRDALEVAKEALGVAEEVGDASTMARALFVLGSLQRPVDPEACRRSFERSRDLARESGDDWCFAASTTGLGWAYVVTEEFDLADPLFEESLPIVERNGFHEHITWTLFGASQRYAVDGDHERFLSIAQRAVDASREVGEPASAGAAQAFIARIEITMGRPEEALRRLEESRVRLIATGAGLALPHTEVVLAVARGALGDLESARARLEEAVSAGADYGWILTWALVELGDVLRMAGDMAAAEERARQALEINDRIRSPGRQAWAKAILGRVATARGEWSEAETLLHDALAIRAEGRMRWWLTQTLDAFAELAAGTGRHEEAVRLLGAAHSARSDFGYVRWAPEESAFEALGRELREQLGDDDYEAAWHEGARLTLEEAVAWLRRGRGSRKRPPGGWESLTPTELEVARHAAGGLTNVEIGEAMFISRGTVKSHLSHIYTKLGVRNRAELTAEATKREPAARA